MLCTANGIEHFLDGFVHPDKYRSPDNAVADVQLFDSVNACDVPDIPIVQTVAGVYAETVFASKNRHVLDSGKLPIDVRGGTQVESVGKMSRVKFGKVRPDFFCGLDLIRIRVDEYANGYIVVFESGNGFGKVRPPSVVTSSRCSGTSVTMSGWISIASWIISGTGAISIFK